MSDGEPPSELVPAARPSPIARQLALSIAALGVVAWLGWFAWPRRADLRGFDPTAVARLETRMWRSYYEHRRLALAVDLYRLSREEYGFSPWAGVRIAWHAARAAMIFQPTKNRAAAERAIPALERYYAVLLNNSGEGFDAKVAAREEFEWWQLRRENRGWRDYAPNVARVTATIYGLSESDALPSARLRAEMMARRDAKREHGPTERDWREIEAGLVMSWSEVKALVAR